MTMTHQAESLEDVAEYFTLQASRALDRLDNDKKLSAKERAALKKEYYCWTEAAILIRTVKLKGYNGK
ncbi:MAG TPA: hypothetical protein VNS88_09090 [Nitrospiraceae bacterium]|nr:hypothetical protein [Nitrospiraceae bacterium]